MTKAIGVTASKVAKPAKLQGFRVRLYGDHNRVLFQWTGKAAAGAAAETSAYDNYNLALKALCQTQRVSASPRKLDLEVRSSEVQSGAGQDGWRISFFVPQQIKSAQGATLTKLPLEELRALVSSAVLTDPACREAARALEPMRVGLWFAHAGNEGLHDIGACLLIQRGNRQVRHQFADVALRDALRFVNLRTSVPFSGGTALPSFHPFAGPSVELLLPGSATIRTIILTDPPQPPEMLLQWLEGEGYAPVADRLRATF